MSTSFAALLDRIQARKARVGIIGLGYVGLPLAAAFCRSGFKVIGFDIDTAKVQKLQAGESYIKQILSGTIRTMREQGFEATDRFDRLDEPDAILICVPTPLTDAREPDLTFVQKSGEAISVQLRPGQLVVLESTTYPTTTRKSCSPCSKPADCRQVTTFSSPSVRSEKTRAILSIAWQLFRKSSEGWIPPAATSHVRFIRRSFLRWCGSRARK